jgi:polyisoprenoid-binding protein YceI
MQTAAQRGPATVIFVIDRSVSRFTVQAFATGLLSSFGHNPTIAIRDYDGVIQFTQDSYDNASVRMNLKTTGLDVLDEMKSSDRKQLEQAMYAQVLDVEHFPTATYESKDVKVEKAGNGSLSVRVNGTLWFHGVTQSQPIDARIVETGSMLRVSGGFEIRQSEFGIKPVSFAAGALRLKDELKFKFELVARRQDESVSSA